MADFHFGQRVVYVNEGGSVTLRTGWRKWHPILGKRLHHNLVRGEVYTVEGYTRHQSIEFGLIGCVWIKGFRFREDPRIAFPAVWFRPVHERKTDISIFRSILTDAPKHAETVE